MSTSVTPAIGDFVLYAERSLILRERACVRGGDLGVRSVARSTGAQLRISEHVTIDVSHSVFSPSISLGRGVTLGRIFTNGLNDDGIDLGPVFPFPALTMPALPLAPAPSATGADITVVAGETVVLQPGTYGCLTVLGRLDLIAGNYAFASVLIGDGARICATSFVILPGGGTSKADGDSSAEITRVSVRQFMNSGRGAIIAPSEGGEIGRLQIFVAGSDTSGRPAVSFGERSEVRAILVAPHGTVALADHVRAAGAFAAFDITVGEEVEVEFSAGLSQAAAAQQGTQSLTGYYGVNPNLNVAPVAGPIPAETAIDLTIGLPVQNPAGLKTFIKQVSDPKKSQFRRHLTQAQFAATYGAPSADYESLKAWATAKGFQIKTTYPTNLLLRITGTAETIQTALYVNLVFRYRSDGSQFVAVDREPSIDFAVPILEIGGLRDSFVPRSAGQFGTGTAAAYRAADLRNAYLGVNSANQALDGTGQVVGILGLDTLQLSDVTGYAALQLPCASQPALKTPNVTLINSSGAIGKEGTGDVEMVLAMAPGAQVLFFHGSTGITGHADDALHAMANSTPPLTSASCSWVFGRSDNSQQALDQMAAQGVSFFVASGDFGDVGDPQGNLDMENQTLVGGTILNTSGPPTLSPSSNPVYPSPFYAFEQTWNQATAPQQKQVTGGGVMNGDNEAGDPYGQILGIANLSGPSNCFCWPYPFCCGSGVPIPDYQVAVMQSGLGANGGSQQFRNYPDVAIVATNIEIFFQGQPTFFGGTSAAAPLWAGYMALVNQNSIANGQGLGGFLNPTLYDIGLTRGTAVDLFSLCFNNIHDGVSNFDGFGPGFISVPGYNLCTGWGSPTPALLDQLSTLTPLTPNQPLVLITISITTGADDAGGGENGSEQTATIFLPDGGSFTLTLRTSSDAHWDNWTTHTITFPIPAKDSSSNPIPPLTPTSGITGVQINLVQNNPSFAADNWDIFALRVSLSTPGFPPVCQLCLIGDSKLQDGSTGLVRLSKSAGSSGNGPNSPVFSAPPAPPAGTALTQIQFIVATGNDDLGGGQNGSSATAKVFLSGGGSFTITLRPSNAPKWENWTTNSVIVAVPATDDQGNPVPPLTPESGITGVQINLVQNNPSIAADNWDLFALEVSLLSADSSVQVPQLCMVGTSQLQDGSIGLVRLSLTAGSSGSGPSTQVFATGPGSSCSG